MIAIADAGGTRTEWRFLDRSPEGTQITQLETGGFGLSVSLEKYSAGLSQSIERTSDIQVVHFYGAGLHGGPFFQAAQAMLKSVFPHAEINLASDMLAAARGLCGKEFGFVGVLGTGANFAHFDGEKIDRKIPPLGYVLGDEGSGAHLGKQLITDYLRGKLDETLAGRLAKRIGDSEQEIVSKVYGSEGRQFLASQTRFIQQNINHPYTYKLVYDSFGKFFEVFLPEEGVHGPIHFTGSVAFYFGNILRQAGTDVGVSIGNIVESPIAGLTLYHENNLSE